MNFRARLNEPLQNEPDIAAHFRAATQKLLDQATKAKMLRQTLVLPHTYQRHPAGRARDDMMPR